MRCRNCGEKWTLEDGLLGGETSPGAYFAVATTIGAVSALLSLLVSIGKIDDVWSLGALFGMALTMLLLMMSVLGSGYKKTATCYVGSICPKCGHKNWIWPWNF